MRDDQLTIGQRIAQARRELGVRLRHDIGVREMATGARVSYEAARSWEAGTKKPSEESLEALADYLGVTLAWLRYGTGIKMAEAKPDETHELPDATPGTKEA